ncbi:hypothetical protein M405DRAFT_475871 [Rhizopogon salebrosus TDB-379]|nr:hypothetical protein M405DRAFT_475871 [Rhizopogon salebrosus TDB-379]
MTVTSNSPSFWPLIEANYLWFKFSVAATAIIFYDYGLVFRREVELIWRERWSLTTVLYLITRYLGLAIVVIQMCAFGHYFDRSCFDLS